MHPMVDTLALIVAFQGLLIVLLYRRDRARARDVASLSDRVRNYCGHFTPVMDQIDGVRNEVAECRSRLAVAEKDIAAANRYIDLIDGRHRADLIAIRARLADVDRIACQAHGQSCLTDDRVDEFEMWADVARTDVLGRVEEAASGLVTAANVLRLMGAGAASQSVPDATTETPAEPGPAPLDERHHDDDGPNHDV